MPYLELDLAVSSLALPGLEAPLRCDCSDALGERALTVAEPAACDGSEALGERALTVAEAAACDWGEARGERADATAEAPADRNEDVR